MLEYANSLNQKRGVSRRTVVCWAASCLFHAVFILVLFLFPELLAGGYNDQFRGFRWGTDTTDLEPWRIVAILDPPTRMNMPSLETLRKSMGLGDRDEGAGTPPVQVRFGPPEALETDNPPLPQIPPKIEKPEVVLPASSAQNTSPDAETNTGNDGESERPAQADLGTGSDMIAAKPEPAPRIEVAMDAVPRKIPDSIRPPAPPSPPSAESAGAKEPGGNSDSNLFDTRGFPLGNYEEVVVSRVKSKWFIPSNLKQSQGRTIVIFYISKDGQHTGLRIALTSGNRSLDVAALSAVAESSPFPPLPKDFPGDRIGVRLALIVEP